MEDLSSIDKSINDVENSLNGDNFDNEYDEYNYDGKLLIYAQECDNILVDDAIIKAMTVETATVTKRYRVCIKGDCPNIASFGNNGTPEYCSFHSPNDAIDLTHKKCEKDGCNTSASYGVVGTRHVQFCSKHYLSNMENLKNNKCIFIDEKTGKKCNTTASCNNLGETIRLYCIPHKLPNMVDISNINNLCKTDKEVCPKRATFNKKGEKSALFCQTHASHGMVNVLDKRKCETCNDKRPMYNFAGEKKGRFCYKDREKGMINIFAKKCENEDCNKNPIFNKPEFKNGIRCIEHKDGDMIDIRHKRCKTPLCLTRANKKFDMYCFYCFVNLFPNDERVRDYKTKKKEVANFIKITYPNLNWIEDRVIKDGCSRRRPDLLLDIAYDAYKNTNETISMSAVEEKNEEKNNQIIIIETDENAHAYYESICENRRLMELSQDLNHRPLIVIKFNPDKYKKDGKNIQSCWEIDKQTGLSVIRKSKKAEWAFRLNELKKEIDKWMNTKSDKMLEIIRLFYTEEE